MNLTIQKDIQNIKQVEWPFIKYILYELVGAYDRKSLKDRILYYRWGWRCYEHNGKKFKTYQAWVMKTYNLKTFIIKFESVLYLTACFLVIISIDFFCLHLFSRLGIWGILILFIIIIVIIIVWLMIRESSSNNLDHTKEFFEFINRERENFNFFQSIAIDDDERATLFLKHLDEGKDFVKQEDAQLTVRQQDDEGTNDYDKTIKLLLIDFILGKPGALNDYIVKLVQNYDKVHRQGIYKVLSQVMGVNKDNIQYMIEKKLQLIRNNKPSSQRLPQLLKVKKVFDKAGLDLLANDVDNLIKKK